MDGMGNFLLTFLICAYGESPYLQDCVESLVNQTVNSLICIATATPNELISSISSSYSLPLYIRDGNPGIADDWNYAISCVDTPFVTIAHQDDVYSSDYAKRAVSALSKSDKPQIYFTDYGELRDGVFIESSALARIKRYLLKPYTLRALRSRKVFKRLPLSFGNPICCPSVTYALDNLPNPLFNLGFRSNLDWDAWERFSRYKGEFIYDDGYIGMHHRVHGGSETSSCIVDDVRTKEDFEMLCRFWPKLIASGINCFYRKAQKLN